MNFRQLRAFATVAKTGNIVNAAPSLSLTPSAISQQLLAIEEELGQELFDRSTRPPTLNTYGLNALSVIEEILTSYEQLQALMKGDTLVSVLNVGTVRTSALTIIPSAVVALKQANPGLKIKLRIGQSESLFSDVLAGRLDVAITAETPVIPKGLSWKPFINEPLVVIMPTHIETNDYKKSLTQAGFIRFSNNVPLANLIDSELARSGIRPTEVAEIDTVWTIALCVQQGLGVGIVPQLVYESIANENIKAIPFGNPQVYRNIGLVSRSSNKESNSLTSLYKQLKLASGKYGI